MKRARASTTSAKRTSARRAKLTTPEPSRLDSSSEVSDHEEDLAPPSREPEVEEASRPAADEAEERDLEAELFGTGAVVSTRPKLHLESSTAADDDLFVMDNTGAAPEEAESASAWADPDDDRVRVSVEASSNRLRKLRRVEDQAGQELTGREFTDRLRSHHEDMYGLQALSKKLERRAREAPGDEDEPLEALSRSTARVLRSTSSASGTGVKSALSAGGPHARLGQHGFKRLADLNKASPSKSVVSSLDWSLSGVVLTAGLDKSLRLFGANQEGSPLLKSVFFKELPIHKAEFVGVSRSTIVLSGRRPFYYTYDVETSLARKQVSPRPDEASLETFTANKANDLLAFGLNDGFVSLVSTRGPPRSVGSYKVEGSVRALAFDSGHTLLTSGEDGDVYKWDLRAGSKRPLWRIADKGNLGTTCLTAHDERVFAVGSSSGIVNVYRDGRLEKEIFNLVTPVTALSFSHDGSMLVLASKRNADAVKLYHVPSQRVVADWPRPAKGLGYVQCAAFEPATSQPRLVLGNDKGVVLTHKFA